MNKEYLYLSNNELLVTDEKGHVIKRNISNENINDILLLENDLEKINKTIDKLEKELHDEEENRLTKKDKIFFSIMPFFMIMSLGFIACLFSPVIYSNIILITISAAVADIIANIPVMLDNRSYNKHINGTKSELITAYQLREEMEQNLDKIKEKEKNSITTDIVDSKKINPNIHKPIILENSTPFYEDIKKQLNESYTAGYKQKVKKLTLKK